MDDVDETSPNRGVTLNDLLANCADSLRRLPESRLNKAIEPARNLAQLLADAALGIEARAGEAAPRRRVVPVLSVFAVGDQIAVTARDFAHESAGLNGTEPVWWHGGRHPLSAVLDELIAAAESLRGAL